MGRDSTEIGLALCIAGSRALGELERLSRSDLLSDKAWQCVCDARRELVEGFKKANDVTSEANR